MSPPASTLMTSLIMLASKSADTRGKTSLPMAECEATRWVIDFAGTMAARRGARAVLGKGVQESVGSVKNGLLSGEGSGGKRDERSERLCSYFGELEV
jgi:hypothetical protein